MNILKSIKVNQGKFIPAIGFGYWKNNYTGEYGQVGHMNFIQIPFYIHTWGVVNIVKQEQTLLQKIKEIIIDLRVSSKTNWDQKINAQVIMPESYMHIFNNNIREEQLNAGLVINATANTGDVNCVFNAYSTFDGTIYVNHDPSNKKFSVEIIEK